MSSCFDNNFLRFCSFVLLWQFKTTLGLVILIFDSLSSVSLDHFYHLLCSVLMKPQFGLLMLSSTIIDIDETYRDLFVWWRLIKTERGEDFRLWVKKFGRLWRLSQRSLLLSRALSQSLALYVQYFSSYTPFLRTFVLAHNTDILVPVFLCVTSSQLHSLFHALPVALLKPHTDYVTDLFWFWRGGLLGWMMLQDGGAYATAAGDWWGRFSHLVWIIPRFYGSFCAQWRLFVSRRRAPLGIIHDWFRVPDGVSVIVVLRPRDILKLFLGVNFFLI